MSQICKSTCSFSLSEKHRIVISNVLLGSVVNARSNGSSGTAFCKLYQHHLVLLTFILKFLSLQFNLLLLIIPPKYHMF